MKKTVWGMGVAAVAGSLFVMSSMASAQTTAPVAAPVKPAAPVAAAPASPAAAAKAAVAKVTPIVCKGKEETSCKTEAATCSWIVPTKVEATGKVDKPYCRRTAGVAKKAQDAATATKAALTKAGAAAKAAVTPATPAAAPAAVPTAPAAPAKK